MTFLLDTNVVSETFKADPNPACETWLEANRGECSLSTVTISEIRYGIERLPEGKRKAAAESDYRFLVENFSGVFFDFDGPAAAEWGRYAAELEGHFGSDWWKTYDIRDTQIAAIAREYGLVVATRNTRHFPFCDVVDPFKRNRTPEI